MHCEDGHSLEIQRPARRILVAALTCNRPAGLAALLDGFATLNLPTDPVEFLIVDNSADASARFLVTSRAARFPAPLLYRNEPERGLSQARNAALAYALERADLMAFVDDDEVPRPDWLLHHVKTIDQTGCEVSLGAVHARFAAEPGEWMIRGGFQEVRGLARHAPMRTGSTSNVMFDLSPVRRIGLRFDTAFSLTGGEDTEFFDVLRHEGGRMLFTPEAVVTETIVPHRATLGWLMRRWRRTGATDAMIRMKRRAGRGTRVICLAGGIVRIALGSVMALASLPLALSGRAEFSAKALRIAARGLGFAGGALGQTFEEYRTLTR
jgi:succinoglycan biosynthesis protein ExoM